MENYRRPTSLQLEQRLQEPVRRLIVVAGPRQVGKTTAVRQVLGARTPDSCRFHAVDAPEEPQGPTDYSLGISAPLGYPEIHAGQAPRDKAWLINRWQEGREAARKWRQQQVEQAIATQRHASSPDKLVPYVLVFDEIQHIADWSSVVKGLWDQDRAQAIPMHVVVLGSAPLLMQRGLGESLMGRFELVAMSHWSYSEMRDCFDFTLDQYIYFGGYPGPATWVMQGQETRWREEVLHSLIEPNLVKDILALARIEKPAVLRQLFELGCGHSGQVVALTKLLVQLQDAGNTTTLTHYLKLLGAAGLMVGLEKFAATAMRQRAAPPKLNALNTAFVAVYSGRTFEQARADHAFWGHLVESSIGAHLINTAADGVKLSYWRESPFEVDFVVQHGESICALEVKSTSYRAGSDRGLRAFADKHAQLRVKTHMVGGDDHALAEALTETAMDWLSR
jgi:predicted AAA+ superfamily ATPase